MKVIIFHGTGDSSQAYWYQWLKGELEKQGHSVETPDYPKTNRVPVDELLPEVLANHTFDKDTVLVGHSSGVPLILSILERIDTKIFRAVLVAGFCSPLPGDTNPILQDSYNWPVIRKHADAFVMLNSDNDPWGCNDVQGRAMFDQLGGALIIRHEGHFGSNTTNQPYPEFPLLRDVILEPVL